MPDMLYSNLFIQFLLGSLKSLPTLLSICVSCPKERALSVPSFTATVHLPRIGYATKGFNWYGTERLIRKYLATRGIPTLMYPFAVCFIWFTI